MCGIYILNLFLFSLYAKSKQLQLKHVVIWLKYQNKPIRVAAETNCVNCVTIGSKFRQSEAENLRFSDQLQYTQLT